MLLEKTVTIPGVRVDVFERLQKLATPLVDDINAVLMRLLDRNEQLLKQPVQPSATPVEEIATLWRGAVRYDFPVGTKLVGLYLKTPYQATVVKGGVLYEGTVYESFSPAAIAAKKSTGASEKTASTNGWEFWKWNDGGTLKSLDKFKVTKASAAS